MRMWLVEMKNNVDPRDDEAWKVRAETAADAREEARGRSDRFSTGRIVPARGGSKADRVLAQSLREMCTRTI